MDKKEIINTLNNNLEKFSHKDASRIITTHLLDKEIALNRIQIFLREFQGNPILALNGTYTKCLKYSIEYLIRKHSINSIIKDKKTLLYF